MTLCMYYMVSVSCRARFSVESTLSVSLSSCLDHLVLSPNLYIQELGGRLAYIGPVAAAEFSRMTHTSVVLLLLA